MKTSLGAYKARGMSLLEVMLVLAIASSIMLAGLRIYQSFDRDSGYLILRSNVDLLFQAMKTYYQDQCNLYFSPDSSIRASGALTFNSNNPAAPVPFDVNTTKNYLSSPWPRGSSVLANKVISSTYFAQFNPSTVNTKQAYVCSSFASPQCSAPAPIPGSNVVLWQSQVAVKMKDPTMTTYYLAVAGADCAVNSLSGKLPVDCSTGVSMGNSATYMVWQRMPSFSSPTIKSSLWISNPVTKLFKLQYTHDPMYELYNSSAEPSEVYKYYYCGG